MCDTSTESCVLWLHFFFLHLRALSDLWGRYDQKTKKIAGFWLVAVSFLHTESKVMHLLKAPLNTFISAPYTNKI